LRSSSGVVSDISNRGFAKRDKYHAFCVANKCASKEGM